MPAFLCAQSQKVAIEHLPAWVIPVAFDDAANPPAGQESGFYYLLVDEQDHTLLQEHYLHFAYKILTSDGIQAMSDISFNFDPTFQQARLHQIRVHRNGTITDQLTNRVQIMQREQSMDRFLYDGSLTAVINLSDIRVGDVIEFAYSIKGYNPVYNGHVSRKIYFNFNLPFEKSYQRLIVPRNLSLDLEYRNIDVEPQIKTAGGEREYTWTLNQTNALNGRYTGRAPDRQQYASGCKFLPRHDQQPNRCSYLDTLF